MHIVTHLSDKWAATMNSENGWSEQEAGMAQLDNDIGLVLQHLKDMGEDDNTIVVFTSDNGGADYIGLPEINKPFRGWKMTFFEGGVHSPFFMRWPGMINANTHYSSPVGHIDIFPTAAAAGPEERHGHRPYLA